MADTPQGPNMGAGGTSPGGGGDIPGDIGKGPDSPLPEPGSPVDPVEGADSPSDAGGSANTGSAGDAGSSGGGDSSGPALGAGGTSPADDGSDGDPDSGSGMMGGKSSGASQAGKMAAGTAATGAAAQGALLMMFLIWLRSLAAMVAAALMNLWNMIVGFIVGIAKSVAGFFMGIGAGIANLVGGAVSAVTGAVTSAISTVAVAAVTASAVVSGGIGAANTTAQRDDVYESCAVAADASLSDLNEGTSEVDGETASNAETVYSVLSAWGMPDENIAGILGNWDAESGIDPTGVEGIYDEPFSIGSQKKKKLDNGTNTFGIGLGQWTFERHDNLLDYSDSNDSDWYTLEMQLGFMVSDKEGSDAEVVKNMIENPLGSPGEAAVHFHDKWERSADTSMDARKSNAEKWFAESSTWDADESLADSILDQAETTVDGANKKRKAGIESDCAKAGEDDGEGGGGTPKAGGMTEEEAQELVDLYNDEGDAFLDARYGAGGGPGSCGSNHAMNCVSFSVYFLNKYTEFQDYPRGNGIDTAATAASMHGTKTTHTPTAYSIASGPGSGAAGHTFVVLGVTKDHIVLGEAGYCAFMGRVRTMPIDEATSGIWEYFDVSDIMLDEDKVKTK